MAERPLGNLEFGILSVLISHSRDAYGASIHERLEAATGHDYSIGAIYTALDRLERKGYVRSWWGERTAERGGRRKRYYRVQAPGIAAVRRTEAVYKRPSSFGLPVPGAA